MSTETSNLIMTHHSPIEKIKVAIVGGTGYTGIELIRLLLQHPEVEITVLTSRTEAGTKVAELFPSLRGVVDLVFSPLKLDLLTSCDVVFFATPHGVAMEFAPDLVAAGVKVIDLAADFRLQNLTQFEHWYGMSHTCPDLLKQAVYGLPEINRERIKVAQVIGNPGCYPTTVQLGLAPLLDTIPILDGSSAHRDQILSTLDRPSLIDYRNIIVDAKSGVSGAGRKGGIAQSFCENSDNFKAYAVNGHRHHPEIVQGLEQLTGQTSVFDGLTFVPHLVPMLRGMLSTIYVQLTAHGQQQDIQALYEQYYHNERFVDVMPAHSQPETRSVRGANDLRIALYRPQPERLIIVVVQDNLVKGAAGQAIQNMNLMFGFPEEQGLNAVGLLP